MTVLLGLTNSEERKVLQTNSGHAYKNDGRNITGSVNCGESKGFFQNPDISSNKPKVWIEADTDTDHESDLFISVHTGSISIEQHFKTLKSKLRELKRLFRTALAIGKNDKPQHNGCYPIDKEQEFHKGNLGNSIKTPEKKMAACAEMTKLPSTATRQGSPDEMTESAPNAEQYCLSGRMTELAENASTQSSSLALYCDDVSWYGHLNTIMQLAYSFFAGVSFEFVSSAIFRIAKHSNSIQTSDTKMPECVEMKKPQSSAVTMPKTKQQCQTGKMPKSVCLGSIKVLALLILLHPFQVAAHNNCTGSLMVDPQGPIVEGGNLSISCQKGNGTPRWESDGPFSSLLIWNGYIEPAYRDKVTLNSKDDWYNITIIGVTASNLTTKYVCHVGNKCQATRRLSDYKCPSDLLRITEVKRSEANISVQLNQTNNHDICTHVFAEFDLDGSQKWMNIYVGELRQMAVVWNFTLTVLQPERTYHLRLYIAYSDVIRSNYTDTENIRTAANPEQQKKLTETEIIVIGVVVTVALLVVLAVVVGCFRKQIENCCQGITTQQNSLVSGRQAADLYMPASQEDIEMNQHTGQINER